MRIRVRTIKKVFVFMAAAMLMLTSTVLAKGQEKVVVCHVEGNGSFSSISIAVPALDSHLAHGDAQPGADVPFMPNYKFDASCTPVLSDPCTAAVQQACAMHGGYCISGSATCILPSEEEFYY